MKDFHKIKLTEFWIYTADLRLIWMLLPLAITFVSMNLTPLKEGDLWWHLKIGEAIYTTRSLHLMDPFSFNSIPSYNVATFGWLSELLFFLLERLGGLSSLVLLQTLISFSIIYILFRFGITNLIPSRVISIILIICWLGLYPFSSLRPQIFSFLLFTIFYMLLDDFYRGRQNRLWLLPVLMLLWINLHGGWIMGFALWAIYLFDMIIVHFRDSSKRKSMINLLAWGVLMLLVLPINPEGIFFESIFSQTNNLINQKYVSEWQPLGINSSTLWLLIALFLVWMISLTRSYRTKPIHEILLMSLFMVSGIRYLRMAPFYFIVAAPIVMRSVASLKLGRLFEKPSVLTTSGASGNTQLTSKLNRIIILLFIFVALFSLPPMKQLLLGSKPSGFVSSYFPVDAVDNILPDTAHRIFTSPEWAGYVIWQLHPPTTVFVDGRIPIYPLNVWEDYLVIALAEDGWDQLLDQYHVDLLILSKDSHSALIDFAVQSGWHEVLADEVSVVLVQPDNPIP